MSAASRRLEGRVAVVTGAARGIGAATARILAAEGAAVVLGDTLEADGEATARSIVETGGHARFVRADVTNRDDCRALVQAAADEFGKLDVLVCCAGILRGAFQSPEDLEVATFDQVLDVNVRGTFQTVQAAVPHLRGRGGVILLLASGAGVRGPSSSLAYGTSKGGVHGLAMTLEAHLAPHGIRVNDVCPGAIDTEMKRENVRDSARLRGADPEEALAQSGLGDPRGVARILAFLASPDADYVTGSTYYVDGGLAWDYRE
jgi:NAD(P)-dependent dehydrogenase (short-subunit alcohol dehydrogenase family)